MSKPKPYDGWLVVKCESDRVEKLFGLMGEDQADERRTNYEVRKEDSELFVPLGDNGGASVRVLVSLTENESTSRFVEMNAPNIVPIRLSVEEAHGLGQALLDAATVAAASDSSITSDDVAEALYALGAANRSEA